MGRKSAVIYSRITLSTPELIESTRRWAQKRYRVERVVIENSEAQPKLQSLLRLKGITVIAPDAYHLAAPDQIPVVLAQATTTVVLARERVILSRAKTAVAFRLSRAIVVARAQARHHNGRIALQVARIVGKRIGRPALPDDICDRAVALLKEGKQSLRAIAQETGISKSAVQRLAKTLKR